MNYLVYRIENKRGIGPYQIIPGWNSGKHVDRDHPSLWDEMEMLQNLSRDSELSEEFVFGFKDIQQAKEWFSDLEDVVLMHDFHFQISVYEVGHENLSFGRKQVIFYKTCSLLVETKPIDFLLSS